MLEKNHFPLLLILAFGIFLNGCSSEQSADIDEIHIEGVLWACNISTSYATFGSAAESEDDPEVRLPATAGDLLYMLSDDVEFYYRYRKEDGKHLVVSYDTSGIISGYLNGQLSFIELTDEPSKLELFSAIPGPRLKQVKTLLIREELSDAQLSAIQKQESSLYGTGIILENKVGAEQLYKLLSICRPGWIAIDGHSELSGPDQGEFLTGLDLLWINGDIAGLSKNLRCCSNLESLIITEWEPKEGELVPLTELKKLHSLTLVECGLIDLSGIEFPASLKRLHLVMCDTLSDITKLSSVPELNSLILSGCEDVQDPEVIAELTSLQWLSVPPNISQPAFKTIVESLPSLRVLELLGCTLINDLSILANCPKLEVLVLDLEKEQMSGLEKLEQLGIMILTSKIFENHSELITELRAALPDTKIVPGSGICLGSGWLLFLLPLALLSYILFRKKKQNYHITEN